VAEPEAQPSTEPEGEPESPPEAPSVNTGADLTAEATEDYEDRWRALADLDNLRKRHRRELPVRLTTERKAVVSSARQKTRQSARRRAALRTAAIRRTALRHACFPYLFGTGILASTINLVVSLSSR
jgi:hypothetical protein